MKTLMTLLTTLGLIATAAFAAGPKPLNDQDKDKIKARMLDKVLIEVNMEQVIAPIREKYRAELAKAVAPMQKQYDAILTDIQSQLKNLRKKYGAAADCTIDNSGDWACPKGKDD